MCKFIKRNWGFILSIAFFIAAFVTYIIDSKNDKIALGFIGISATLYFGTLRYRIENDKMFKELFTEFNLRYNDEFNNLMNSLRTGNNRKLDTDEINVVIDYLNLCSEEYLWYRKKRIPNEIWCAWKLGILENVKIHQVKDICTSESSTKDLRKSYYGLFEELKFPPLEGGA